MATPLHRADLLLTTAQIGMALAGFAGLVTLLGRPGLREGFELNEIRFRSMIELSLFLVGFALLPFLPAELGLDRTTLWRAGCAVYALAALVFLAHSTLRNRRLLGRVVIAGGATVALFAVGAILAALLVLAAAGGFAGHEASVYLAALFLHLGAAAFFFIRLLYGAFPEKETGR